MPDKNPSPLQACFWLTRQEKQYILVICALVLLGTAARFFYLKKEAPAIYTPDEIASVEMNTEVSPKKTASHAD